jgi:hypothetical protein
MFERPKLMLKTEKKVSVTKQQTLVIIVVGKLGCMIYIYIGIYKSDMT